MTNEYAIVILTERRDAAIKGAQDWVSIGAADLAKTPADIAEALQIAIDCITKVSALKLALEGAIFDTHRVAERCIKSDPAGGTYEVDWTEKVKAWAKLADVDLSTRDPFFYARR